MTSHLSLATSTQRASIPYPPVFHDWRPDIDRRVATSSEAAGVGVEMSAVTDRGDMVWHRVELTEDDACLLAASLLTRAGHKKLANRVLKKLDKQETRS